MDEFKVETKLVMFYERNENGKNFLANITEIIT